MQGIYNYMPETNHVSTVCSVAAILYLQFMVHIIIFPMLNIFYIYLYSLLLLLSLLSECWTGIKPIIILPLCYYRTECFSTNPLGLYTGCLFRLPDLN
jgi:hypothetical protein